MLLSKEDAICVSAELATKAVDSMLHERLAVFPDPGMAWTSQSQPVAETNCYTHH